MKVRKYYVKNRTQQDVEDMLGCMTLCDECKHSKYVTDWVDTSMSTEEEYPVDYCELCGRVETLEREK